MFKKISIESKVRFTQSDIDGIFNCILIYFYGFSTVEIDFMNRAIFKETNFAKFKSFSYEFFLDLTRAILFLGSI